MIKLYINSNKHKLFKWKHFQKEFISSNHLSGVKTQSLWDQWGQNYGWFQNHQLISRLENLCKFTQVYKATKVYPQSLI